MEWPKLFHNGLASSGDVGTGMLLPRAGWIGSWKYGTSLWNGDIGSTLPILATSLKTMIRCTRSHMPRTRGAAQSLPRLVC